MAIAGKTTGILLVIETFPLLRFILQRQASAEWVFSIRLIEGGEENQDRSYVFIARHELDQTITKIANAGVGFGSEPKYDHIV